MNSIMSVNVTDQSQSDDRLIFLFMFILLIIIDIASILCTIFILTFFFVNWRSLMSRVLHNHAIFLLIIISFLYVTLDLPITINHYRLGYDSLRTRSFCLWWYWLDYTLVVISLLLTAIASIQRHILVFHTRWLHSRHLRYFLHYFPLIFCFLYPSLFYFILLFLYPCEHIIDHHRWNCPYPCYSTQHLLFYIDWLVNTICPVLIIVIANVTLITRVMYSMRRFRRCRSRTWRRRRRLTSQLLAFSSLYVLGWIPPTTISIIEMFLLPNLYIHRPNLYHINISSYFVCPLQPFICFFALPKLMKLMKNRLRQQGKTLSALSASLFHGSRFF